MLTLIIERSLSDYSLSLSSADFKSMIGLSRQHFDRLLSMYGDYLEQHRMGRPHRLAPFEELLLVLLFLRHNLVDVLLGGLFGIIKSVARSIRQRMLKYLYEALKERLQLGTEEERRKEGYPIGPVDGDVLTFVLDGSEQPVQCAGNAVQDSRFYSAKKGQHSINTLLVMAPTGRVLYVSPAFPGSVQDTEIVNQTRRHWYDKMAEWEWGLGDEGFKGLLRQGYRIEGTTKANNIRYRAFSSKRIVVEMKFQELKNWRAVRDQVRTPPAYEAQLLEQQHMVWTIAAVFVNEFTD